MMATAVECRALDRGYGSLEVLCGLNMEVATGSIYGLLGPSGCGKTTLLKVLLGRLVPWGGSALALGSTPGEHGAPVPPDLVRGGASASQVREVDDVVVQQRGGVEQLDGCGDRDPTGPRIAAELGREEHQGRPEPLATRRHHVVSNRDHQSALTHQLIAHRALDQLQVAREAREDLRDRRQSAARHGPTHTRH